VPAAQAIDEIVDWVENGEDDIDDDDEGDLFDLNGEDELTIDPTIDPDEPVDDVDYGDNDSHDLVTDRSSAAAGPRVFKRRRLTYQRDVNSINASLEESNYNLLDEPEEPKTVTGYVPDPTKRNKKDKMPVRFVNKRPKGNGTPPASQVIRNKPGVAPEVPDINCPEEAFEYYFTEEAFGKLVHLTNPRIQETVDAMNIPEEQMHRYTYIGETTVSEMRALIGLIYYRGLYGMNQFSTSILFSPRHGPPVFSATMSRQRFAFLLSHLCFDDYPTRAERRKHDRFAAMRDFFETFNKKFAEALVPEDYISLDETLYPMRTQISFKQYNPDKPAKYGILFKSLNSARYPYTYQAVVYAGKPEAEPNDFYITGTAEYIKALVKKLEKYHSLKGRNISMDRLYTSFEIADWLLEHKITMVGTLMMNRVGVPTEMKDIQDREVFSTEHYWREDGKCNFASYVVKTSKGKKNVIVLSTMEPLLGVTKDEKKKPAIIKLYDFTKGGTDIIDQKMGSYTTKSKGRRWTVAAFSYLLDSTRVNATTLYALANNLNPKKLDSFSIGTKIADHLIGPFIQTRPRNGLQSPIIRKIELYTGKNETVSLPSNTAATFEKMNAKRKRCATCLNEQHGENQKDEHSKMSRVKTQCQLCGECTCIKHMDVWKCLKCAMDKK